jgi:hypothetical protein
MTPIHGKVGKFFDASRTKKGRQAIANRLLFMRSITYPWNSKALTNDAIRIEMKNCFFVFLSQGFGPIQTNHNLTSNFLVI